MIITVLIILFILLLYIVLISRYSFGWRNIDSFSDTSFFPQVSLIIAMRNEEDQIFRLLRNLRFLTYPKDKLEIILINDHSTDDTLDILGNSDIDNLQILDMPENKNGKKDAISMGIDNARGEIILTTDADCSFDYNWVQIMVGSFVDNNIKMVAGPVCFIRQEGMLQHFQSLDFLSLVGSGAGAIGINNPIFCNGANMAYRKEVFLQINDFSNDQVASGDDVFLLHSIKARYLNSITFLKHKDAIVFTNSMQSIINLINQRKRWAAKTSAYKDNSSIYVSFLVFITNLSFVVLLLLSFSSLQFFKFFLLFYFAKCIVDYLLLYPVLNFFSRKDLIKWVFIFELIYSFYIILIVILSLINKFEWKGRMHKR